MTFSECLRLVIDQAVYGWWLVLGVAIALYTSLCLGIMAIKSFLGCLGVIIGFVFKSVKSLLADVLVYLR